MITTVWLFSVIFASPAPPMPVYFPVGVYHDQQTCEQAVKNMTKLEVDKDFKHRNKYQCEEAKVR